MRGAVLTWNACRSTSTKRREPLARREFLLLATGILRWIMESKHFACRARGYAAICRSNCNARCEAESVSAPRATDVSAETEHIVTNLAGIESKAHMHSEVRRSEDNCFFLKTDTHGCLLGELIARRQRQRHSDMGEQSQFTVL